MRIEGGSVGFQIGVSETDVVMLVMDQRSMNGILSSKFTLGGAAEVAAGPVGRSSAAQTDATMRAKILSYSRSRGAFAGVALTGATLRQDLDENREMYSRKIENKAILNSGLKTPVGAEELIALLNKYRVKRPSDIHALDPIRWTVCTPAIGPHQRCSRTTNWVSQVPRYDAGPRPTARCCN